MLEEETAADTIAAYTTEQWKPLFDLIPIIENTMIFDHGSCSTSVEDGGIQLYSPNEDMVVMRFLDLVYEMPIIIAFKWSTWDEGRAMANTPDFDFDSVDVYTKCKLITAIARNDRFCTGALVSAFESGFILTLLKSMQRQVDGVT